MLVRNGDEARDWREVIGLETCSKLDLVGENERIRKLIKREKFIVYGIKKPGLLFPSGKKKNCEVSVQYGIQPQDGNKRKS